ncbi:hypothetical protein [Flavobacterium sp.]|jgi:hypothetical protein|uniref:hypothetical protein n=1 Tax=Flavobacterium sp. TaxID=239 RepID=UPI0037BF2005
MKNTHNHPINFLGSKKLIFKEFLNKIPIGIPIKEFKFYAKSELQLTDSQFYYYYNKFRFTDLTLWDLWTDLDSKKYELFIQPLD